MRRGSILHYIIGGQRRRVVVVSARRFNPDKATCVPLRERTVSGSTPVFLVPLNRADWPAPAILDLSRPRALDRSAVAGQAGQLTPATLSNLDTAIHAYFGVGS